MTEHKEHNIQDTSVEAYLSILKKISERHQIIYCALFELCKIQGDATDYEIAKFLSKDDPNYVRPRRYELLNKFKIIELSQKRNCLVTGKNAMAWKIRLTKRFIK
jgi:hypothetical protein